MNSKIKKKKTTISHKEIRNILTNINIKSTNEQSILITLLIESFILQLVQKCEKSINYDQLRRVVRKKNYFFLVDFFMEKRKSKKQIKKDVCNNEISSKQCVNNTVEVDNTITDEKEESVINNN